MDYSLYNLDSLLSQLETAYFLAKSNYNTHQAYAQAQAQRQAIKDEINERFARINNQVSSQTP